MNGWLNKIRSIRPKMLPSFLVFFLFMNGTFWVVFFPNAVSVPVWCTSLISAGAFISLLFLSWSVAIFTRQGRVKEKVKNWSEQSKFLTKLFNDSSFRAIFGMYRSLFFNSILAFWKGWLGIISSSPWFLILGCYYLTLAIVRWLLVRSGRKLKSVEKKKPHRILRWKIYRLTGVFLLIITCLLYLTVSYIVMEGNGFTYDGVWIYGVAFYDFYFLLKESIQLIKARKTSNPVLKAMRAISFLTAMVAMLSLETAMFAAFGSSSEQSFQQLMNALSGTIVCVLSLIMGIHMIVNGTKQLAQVTNEELN
ncbi:hypothetical protein [uncultured Enterococcus sp.]|uniref:hypothetical protein n=1 Tax=uncultured Enterococcus sp. TaxID=167972 RepID=UPI002AA61866|nr:hypothetical protein [uncultured Enterococcus sp.]